jgi:hypothetical protein
MNKQLTQWVYVVLWREDNTLCMEIFANDTDAFKFNNDKHAKGIISWIEVRAVRQGSFPA